MVLGKKMKSIELDDLLGPPTPKPEPIIRLFEAQTSGRTVKISDRLARLIMEEGGEYVDKDATYKVNDIALKQIRETIGSRGL